MDQQTELSSSLITPKEYTPPLAPNGVVTEEAWHSEIECQIIRWRKYSKNMQQLHISAGYHYKTRKIRYGLIPSVLPLIMAPISIVMTDYLWGVYVNAMVLAIVGLFTGLLLFFAPGEKMQKHFSFSTRYADIVTDIDAELIRYRQFRAAADVFTTKIKMAIDNLSFQEPTIPKYIITGKRQYFGEFAALCCCISQKKAPIYVDVPVSADATL